MLKNRLFLRKIQTSWVNNPWTSRIFKSAFTFKGYKGKEVLGVQSEFCHFFSLFPRKLVFAYH